jgi:hypothetical protein
MMVFVMSRYPSEDGHTIENGKPPIRYYIQRLPFPNIQMLVIVRDYRNGNGQMQVNDVNQPMKTIHPLAHKQCSGNCHVNECT